MTPEGLVSMDRSLRGYVWVLSRAALSDSLSRPEASTDAVLAGPSGKNGTRSGVTVEVASSDRSNITRLARWSHSG